MFGRGSDCELVQCTIEPEENNATRPSADPEKIADFKELVLCAYSKRANNSASQLGRELKKKRSIATPASPTESSSLPQ